MRSAVLKKVRGFLRNAGPVATIKRSAYTIVETIQTAVSVRNRRFTDMEKVLDFAYKGSTGGSIRPIQVRSEISQLLRRVEEIKPQHILEIGTANGGTLFLFAHAAAQNGHLISVDLPGGEFGDGYPIWRVPLYRSFAMPGQRIDLLRADSHSVVTRQKIEQLLQETKLDFLFIDGDHRYEGVKADFEMYAPLVRPGGLIAFHDITEFNYDLGHGGSTPESPFGVKRFWDEIKTRFEHVEFIENPRGNFGLGVLWKE
jgi:predicted O-methyltransferase YrrM